MPSPTPTRNLMKIIKLKQTGRPATTRTWWPSRGRGRQRRARRSARWVRAKSSSRERRQTSCHPRPYDAWKSKQRLLISFLTFISCYPLWVAMKHNRNDTHKTAWLSLFFLLHFKNHKICDTKYIFDNNFGIFLKFFIFKLLFILPKAILMRHGYCEHKVFFFCMNYHNLKCSFNSSILFVWPLLKVILCLCSSG